MKKNEIIFNRDIDLYNIAYSKIIDICYSILYGSKLFHQLLLLEGEGYAEIEGQSIYFSEGDILFVPAGDRLRFSVPSPIAVYQLFFSQGSRSGGESYLSLPTHQTRLEAAPMAMQIRNLWLSFQTPEFQSYQRHRANAILHLILIEMAGVQPKKNEKSDALEQLMLEISRDPGRNWELSEMSRRAGLSPAYLTQKVRERYHCSIGKFIRLKRIDRAQLLLESTDMSIGEIGSAVGYPNPQHFNKRFRETLGYSPSQFRDSLQG